MTESISSQKPLPHSEESERAILAGVMLDTAQLATVAGRLTPDDFYTDAHRILYKALLDLQEAGSSVDVRTVQARLEQQNQLERAGGVAYIAQLDLDLPDLSRLDTYVELVKERSVRRQLIGTCSQITRDCYDGGLEAQEALGKAEQAIFGLGEAATQKGFVDLESILQETVPELEERPEKGSLGVMTGFVDFDAKTRGLHPANLIIVAGRPGMGKTSLALNIAQNVAFNEKKVVGIFSLEMSQQELAIRVMSSESGVAFSQLRSGQLSRRQWEAVLKAVRKIDAGNLYIDDSANPSLLEIASKARRLKAERNLSLLIIDYLQLMQTAGRHENRNLEIASITRSLKQLSKELSLPVIALSQLSRQPERRSGDHRPQLADLRESGSIEQDADLVVFVYRDEMYDREDPSLAGQAELIIAKHRNGETGRVELVFFGETTSFKSRAHDAAVPPPF